MKVLLRLYAVILSIYGLISFIPVWILFGIDYPEKLIIYWNKLYENNTRK
mgnify:CR=1 FL=1